MSNIESLLTRILAELEYSNSRAHELEDRIAALESQDKVLSVKEAAEFTQKTSHTLRNWVAKGRLHFVEKGGQRGYLLSELKAIKRV